MNETKRESCVKITKKYEKGISKYLCEAHGGDSEPGERHSRQDKLPTCVAPILSVHLPFAILKVLVQNDKLRLAHQQTDRGVKLNIRFGHRELRNKGVKPFSTRRAHRIPEETITVERNSRNVSCPFLEFPCDMPNIDILFRNLQPHRWTMASP